MRNATGAGSVGRAVTALVVVLVAGCSSAVPGSAVPVPGSVPTTTSTTPPPPVDVIPPPELGVGTLLESHRLAGVTALVQASFPDRTRNCSPSGPFLVATELETAYAVPGAATVLDRYGFVASWGQCHQVQDGPATLTLVMELSDPRSAVRAADELTAAQVADGYETVQLPGVLAPALLKADQGGEQAQAFIPVGRMLAFGSHTAGRGQGLAELDRLMRDQTTLLRSFAPTPQQDVPALPVDPAGLQQRALDPPGTFLDSSGPYDLEGYLRISIDPFRERELLVANGFAGFYSKQSDDGTLSYAIALYAFPGTDQTNAVYTVFTELETAEFGGTPFRLPSVPDAPCFVFEAVGGIFYQRCYVGFRTYLVSVDVYGMTTPDDVAEMDRLLPVQRDLIRG